SRIGGKYPTEVQPLVDDLNALLTHREETVRRALAKAGDLAHGLKTPLAVLSQEAERAERAGQPDLAASIGHQVDRMRRQVAYHLAQARAAASGAALGGRCSVQEAPGGRGAPPRWPRVARSRNPRTAWRGRCCVCMRIAGSPSLST